MPRGYAVIRCPIPSLRLREHWYPAVARNRERDILERAVAAVTEQAAKADALIDDLKSAGLPEDGPVLQAKLIRLELLKVKGDQERELGRWVLDCRRCHRRVHRVSGIGITPGHWAHASLPRTIYPKSASGRLPALRRITP
jgi:hypothetical protein